MDQRPRRAPRSSRRARSMTSRPHGRPSSSHVIVMEAASQAALSAPEGRPQSSGTGRQNERSVAAIARSSAGSGIPRSVEVRAQALEDHGPRRRRRRPAARRNLDRRRGGGRSTLRSKASPLLGVERHRHLQHAGVDPTDRWPRRRTQLSPLTGKDPAPGATARPATPPRPGAHGAIGARRIRSPTPAAERARGPRAAVARPVPTARTGDIARWRRAHLGGIRLWAGIVSDSETIPARITTGPASIRT